jgi:hypothetical protein
VAQTRPPDLVLGFATLFRDAFDAVFGAQHLTWRCFKRSCLASYATVGFLTVLWLALFAEDIKFVNPTLFEILLWIAMVLFINILPDYVSLLKTRYVISRMRRQ